MTSFIGTGEVMHARLQPVHHAFKFPLLMMAVDLAELPALSRSVRGFGYNRRAAVSLRDRDYLSPGDEPIREKLDGFLRRAGMADALAQTARVMLVTCPRVLGYAFNPVSFYFCERADGSMPITVAEVNNTFGERHLYVLNNPSHDEPSDAPAPARASFRADKRFHVSPFNDMEGRYEFEFGGLSRGGVDAVVNLWREETCVFRSRLRVALQPLTSRSLRASVAAQPLAVFLTMPRIWGQAARLYFQRELPVFSKPPPSDVMTIRGVPLTLRQSAARRVLRAALGRLRAGTLEISLPGRVHDVFGGAEPGPAAVIHVHDAAFFTRVVAGGDVGLGESYQAGEWTTPDLVAVLEMFAANLRHFDDRSVWLSWPSRVVNALRHRFRPNSLRGSERNIRAHYDLGNDFYEKFLDPTMMYSCGIFPTESTTLEEAQREKIRAMAALADIRPDHHVLEIGTGWGGFAIETVKRTGCRMTTVTLSREQYALATARVREAGLAERIDVQLRDYRDLDGSFDRIVSIEMLEAVGEKYLPVFFHTCDRLLKPGGRLALQVITIPDQRYDAYRRGCDWIQKHIFPGGFIPSVGALSRASRENSRLAIDVLNNIGPHYATTLAEWRRRFDANWVDLRDLGFDDRFRRTWDYYFSYCEAGFRTGAVGTAQLAMTRGRD